MIKEQFKMIEIYRGKDDKWKGFYNLIISDGNPENDMPIAGPIHPVLAQRILNAIKHNDGMKTEPEIRGELIEVNGRLETGDHYDGCCTKAWLDGKRMAYESVLNEQEDKQ